MKRIFGKSKLELLLKVFELSETSRECCVYEYVIEKLIIFLREKYEVTATYLKQNSKFLTSLSLWRKSINLMLKISLRMQSDMCWWIGSKFVSLSSCSRIFSNSHEFRWERQVQDDDHKESWVLQSIQSCWLQIRLSGSIISPTQHIEMIC